MPDIGTGKLYNSETSQCGYFMNNNFFYCFYSLLFLAGSAAAHTIELLPITLGEGESYSSFRNFPKNFETAKRADVDLFAELR